LVNDVIIKKLFFENYLVLHIIDRDRDLTSEFEVFKDFIINKGTISCKHFNS